MASILATLILLSVLLTIHAGRNDLRKRPSRDRKHKNDVGRREERQLDNIYTTLSEQIADLKQEFQQREANYSVQISQLTATVDRLKEQDNISQSKISNLTSEVNNLKERRKLNQDERALLTSKVNTLQEKVELHRNETLHLKKELTNIIFAGNIANEQTNKSLSLFAERIEFVGNNMTSDRKMVTAVIEQMQRNMNTIQYNTERLAVVAFSAYIQDSSYAPTEVDSPIPFSTTLVNHGSAYNTTTYKFTCRTSGLYYFSFSINAESKIHNGSRLFSFTTTLCHRSSLDNTMDYKSITEAEGFYSNKHHRMNMQVSMGVVIHCHEGDELWLVPRHHVNSIYKYVSVPKSVFSGFLIGII